MKLASDEDDVLGRVLHWASGDERVRAALLTSSRVTAGAPRDILSDYDLALIVSDLAPFTPAGDWVREIAEPLLRVRDVSEDMGVSVQNDMLFFADGVKIDFSIWPVSLTAQIQATGKLPDEFDDGYRVLLDRDGLTRDWPPPRHQAFQLDPPTAEQFQSLLEEFWFVSTYVAKNLWRQEFIPARVIFDYEMKYLIVLKMLAWRAGLDHHWAIQPGFFGKGMQRYLAPRIWDAWLATYSGPDAAEMRAALYATIALFREVAQGVAAEMGFPYPEETDALMLNYLRQIEQLPPREGEIHDAER